MFLEKFFNRDQRKLLVFMTGFTLEPMAKIEL